MSTENTVETPAENPAENTQAPALARFTAAYKALHGRPAPMRDGVSDPLPGDYDPYLVKEISPKAYKALEEVRQSTTRPTLEIYKGHRGLTLSYSKSQDSHFILDQDGVARLVKKSSSRPVVPEVGERDRIDFQIKAYREAFPLIHDPKIREIEMKKKADPSIRFRGEILPISEDLERGHHRDGAIVFFVAFKDGSPLYIPLHLVEV